MFPNQMLISVFVPVKYTERLSSLSAKYFTEIMCICEN